MEAQARRDIRLRILRGLLVPMGLACLIKVLQRCWRQVLMLLAFAGLVGWAGRGPGRSPRGGGDPWPH